MYGVKAYGDSNSSLGANLLVGTRVVAGGGLLNRWRKPVVGSNPTLSAKITECSAVWSACLLWKQKVVGSNPTTPINFLETSCHVQAFLVRHDVKM